MNPRRLHAFTLIELLAVIAIIGVLAAIIVPVIGHTRAAARAAASMSNLRQLAAATHAYIADNRGFFPPASSFDNKTRWHGARTSSSAAFDPAKGFLGPYLGKSGAVKTCPQFELMDRAPESASFEAGAGGYGYNAAYLGGPAARGTADDPFRPAAFARLPAPTRTVMFTTTAFARSQGLQDYPFSEPPLWLNPAGLPESENQPSVHFRFNGKALVAWCDGRVSAELPNPDAWPGPNVYGGDNRKAAVGWFGPIEGNGYWNPHYSNLAP